MDITLYYAPRTCALAPFVTLNETGAAFTVKALNFRNKEQWTPEYLRLNPKHKVPLLVVDGRTITESAAIQMWIARTFPQANLMPADPWDEIQALSIMSWCSSGIHPSLSQINTPSKVCDAPGSAESVTRLASEQVNANLRILDDMLAGREFLFSHFTAPDAHVFWCLRRAGELGVEVARYPNCQAFFERVSQRPSVRKVIAFEAKTLADAAATANA